MKYANCLLIALFACLITVAAQPGRIDPTFNTIDIGPVTFGTDSLVDAIAVQPDGKVLIGGLFLSYNGINVNAIARLNTDGSVDASFNSVFGANSWIKAISVLPNGKILVAGTFSYNNGLERSAIARLNSDGTIDTTFRATVSGLAKFVVCFAIESDGDIIFAGSFDSCNAVRRKGIARIKPDGEIDTTFDPGSGSYYASYFGSIAIRADGKIMFAARFSLSDPTAINSLARLHADGRLDTTFNAHLSDRSIVNYCIPQPDGRVLIGGTFYHPSIGKMCMLARLTQNGSYDPTFAPAMGKDGEWVYRMVPQRDSAIVIYGKFSSLYGKNANSSARLTKDGAFDTGYIIFDGPYDGNILSAASNNDGKNYVGGDFKSFGGGPAHRGIVRIESDGHLDHTFPPEPNTGANLNVLALTVQRDQKIMVGGSFATFNGVENPGIVRLHPDGTVDETFKPSPVVHQPRIQTINIDRLDRVVIGGEFYDVGPQKNNAIARLQQDGMVDQSFRSRFTATAKVFATVIQSDGKILVGGQFYSYDGKNCNGIIRLNEDGGLDATFNFIGGSSSTIYALALQRDGKIVIGGYFDKVSGVATSGVARLHQDGSLDASFRTRDGIDGGVMSCVMQSDEKIVVAGNFQSYQGYFCSNIVRINRDGSIDNTFDSGSGVLASIWDMVIDRYDRTIITGFFGSYNGVQRLGIVRINTDGSADMSFDPGAGVNNVNAMALQADDKILIGGGFNRYDGHGKNRLARIYGGGGTTSTMQPEGAAVQTTVLYPNPSEGVFSIAGGMPRSIRVMNVLGEVVYTSACCPSVETIDLRKEPSGVYVVMVQDERGESSTLVIKK